jgi:spore germination cell wall hydrolase CwlJ-like protein
MRTEDKPTFEALTDEQALALTLYLEARSEPTKGIIAVGSVILERVRLGYFGGKTIKGVCFKPYQFSCYNSKDPQYEKIALRIASDFDENAEELSKLQTCLMISKGLLSGEIEPNVKAQFYKVVGCPAAWEKEFVHVERIGAHDFYREPSRRTA